MNIREKHYEVNNFFVQIFSLKIDREEKVFLGNWNVNSGPL